MRGFEVSEFLKLRNLATPRTSKAQTRRMTSAESFPGLAVGNPVTYMWVEQ